MSFTFRKITSILVSIILFLLVEAIAIVSPALIPFRKNDKLGYCTKGRK